MTWRKRSRKCDRRVGLGRVGWGGWAGETSLRGCPLRRPEIWERTLQIFAGREAQAKRKDPTVGWHLA